MPNARSKKSGGSKKAQGSVQLRSATSSLSIPVSSRNQKSAGASNYMAPVAISMQQRTRGPRFQSRASDGRMIVIRKRELITPLQGQIGYTVQRFQVNPGLASTFPWLATQAVNWEQYRFRRLCFEYVTRTSTSTIGSIIMAPDYDPEDPTPTSEAQISSYEDAVEDAPWKNISCFIKTENITPGPRKFIRSGAQAGDIKNYDALSFFVASTDFAVSTNCGKLWVDYEVELYVPQIPDSSTSPAPLASSIFRAASAQTFATGVNESLQFDAASPGNDPLNIGNSVNTVAGGVFTPPRGTYKLDYMVSVNDSAVEVFTAIVDIFKNGVINGARSLTIDADGGTNNLSGSDIVRCSGTDTVEVMVNLTGAAGILTSVSNTASVIWTLA